MSWILFSGRFMEGKKSMERVYNVDWIKDSITGNLERSFGCTLDEATEEQIYQAVALTVRDQIMDKFVESRHLRHAEKSRRVYYLSVEFLMGRALHNNILNLVRTDDYKRALSDLNISFDAIAEQEPDPGLGNGGLGRLAACFLDSLATLDMPAMGCSIRYEYGLFRQKIIDGNQVELPDNWLENGCPWEVQQGDTCEVHFGGRVEEEIVGDRKIYKHVDYTTVLAVPYDMPCVGYDVDNVVPLRLWSARAPKRINMEYFNKGDYVRAMDEPNLAEVISKILYPEDNHYEGRELRLKQHYFFTSATMQYIINNYKKHYGTDLTKLPEKVVVHINDTHPGLAIPELMRLLIDQENMTWEDALKVVEHTFAYTNHTIMAEALERWPEEMVKTTLPRIYQILQGLNEEFCKRLWNAYPGQWERIGGLAILSYGQVHMANLCCAFAYSVNGVSQLHAEILKKSTFHDYYTMEPQKYIGITNGITHRRWLMCANPRLTELICEAIGDKWVKDPERLVDLMPFADDSAFLEKFADIKHENKKDFGAWLARHQDTAFDPDTLLDAQAKRLHEYKRQLLNVLHILSLYNRIVDDPTFEIKPRTFLFGAKAAPGYIRAKLIIKLINNVAALVAAHPRASQMIKIIFLENYGVTAAEHLMPAANLSEQLSTAGKEASGTGNMKFMMNGALTIGTMDGANIEIFDRVGKNNIFIFGLTSDQVDALYAGNTYRAGDVYEQSPVIRRIMDEMVDGTLGPNRIFSELYHALLFGDNGGMADPYLVLKDFADYARKQEMVNRLYDTRAWWRSAVINVAQSGYFSSDRTIQEYVDKIWHLKPLHEDK